MTVELVRMVFMGLLCLVLCGLVAVLVYVVRGFLQLEAELRAFPPLPPRTWAERMGREVAGAAVVNLGPATKAPRTYAELRALSDEELWALSVGDKQAT